MAADRGSWIFAETRAVSATPGPLWRDGAARL